MFEKKSYIVPIGISAIRKAQEIKSLQLNPQKGIHVYYNILALNAVNFYLLSIGFQTDLEEGKRWNPLMQTLMDSNPLSVKGIGEVECIPIFPNDTLAYIPIEAEENRIGYVFACIDEENSCVNILGFIRRYRQENISISELEIPEYFSDYLMEIEMKKGSYSSSIVTHINDLITNIEDLQGWKKRQDSDCTIGKHTYSINSYTAASDTSIPKTYFFKELYITSLVQPIYLKIGFLKYSQYTDVIVKLKSEILNSKNITLPDGIQLTVRGLNFFKKVLTENLQPSSKIISFSDIDADYCIQIEFEEFKHSEILIL